MFIDTCVYRVLLSVITAICVIAICVYWYLCLLLSVFIAICVVIDICVRCLLLSVFIAICVWCSSGTLVSYLCLLLSVFIVCGYL